MTQTTEFEDEVRVTLDGEEYPMLMTTYATKQIIAKFGGLDGLGKKMAGSGDQTEMFDNVCWLAALLVNQPIRIYNRKHPNAEKPLFEAEDIAMLTTPGELTPLMEKVGEAITRGSERNVPDGVPAGKNP